MMQRSKDGLDECCNSLVNELTDLYAGWNGTRQFKDSAGRLARMYRDFCWSPAHIEDEIERQFRVFDDDYREMLTVRDLIVWTLCPHHLLPCEFRVWISYMPAPGKVLGLSKFARIAEVLAKKPVIQEQYSTELADTLMTRLNPQGVAVYVIGKHGCMLSRGVRQNSDVVTSVLRGAFVERTDKKQEFFDICRSR